MHCVPTPTHETNTRSTHPSTQDHAQFDRQYHNSRMTIRAIPTVLPTLFCSSRCAAEVEKRCPKCIGMWQTSRTKGSRSWIGLHGDSVGWRSSQGVAALGISWVLCDEIGKEEIGLGWHPPI
jgi:hypothetical protein